MAATYPATLRFALIEAQIKALVSVAMELRLPFELTGTGLIVVVGSAQEAYDLVTRALAAGVYDGRSEDLT